MTKINGKGEYSLFREDNDSSTGEPLYTLVIDGIKKGEHMTLPEIGILLAKQGEDGDE
ncbi:MAG: hypothetical protein IKG47_00760 [Oscillospiraceae bacterium]|nr:hypothetical protein [Clostridiales bacterium]MBR3353877.1 hypothetical protein [Oscillospiraceae bacterium]